MQQINDNFLLFAPKPMDGRYWNNGIPYGSVGEACSLLPLSKRYLGLTVIIDSGSGNGEYWFKDSTQDSGLVAKETSTITGEGGAISMVNSSSNGVSITWSNPSTTPSAVITLGAITPASIVSSGTIAGANLSGSNTGDETAATLRTKLGVASSFNGGYLSAADWSTFNNKQALLVSGTSIKTINGTSILGSGDITITGGSGSSINDTTASTTSTYSSTKVTTLLTGKQDSLVSGSSIKTFNGTSLLGAGDITAAIINDSLSSSSAVYSSFKVTSLLSGKQDNLVSGTSIKTLNGGTLLGSGNITVAAISDTTSTINSTYSSSKVDSLLTGKANSTHTHAATDITTDSTHQFVTAAQVTTFTGKQDPLVSGTNIKTVNGVSILGSGDLPVSRTVATITNTTPQLTLPAGTLVDKMIIITSATITLSMGTTSGGSDIFSGVVCDPPYSVISDDRYFINSTTVYFTGMGSSTIKLYKQ